MELLSLLFATEMSESLLVSALFIGNPQLRNGNVITAKKRTRYIITTLNDTCWRQLDRENIFVEDVIT